MLTKEDNEILTRVGPGTPMGNLLRRYWLPALLSSEVPAPDSPPIRVRLLGEDLVAFRDTDGNVGLFVQSCPHRGASLFFGRNEECGLRCVYHGWKYDVDGNCVDMPSEPAESNFKSKVRVTAYPTHESGGIVWTYMGPQEKMPGFRDFGSESVPRDRRRLPLNRDSLSQLTRSHPLLSPIRALARLSPPSAIRHQLSAICHLLSAPKTSSRCQSPAAHPPQTRADATPRRR